MINKTITLFRYFALTICTLFISNNTFCEEINYKNLRFKQITTSDGLPYGAVREITQDSLGFMWICTRSGLYRYDGSRFYTYLPVENDYNTIGGADAEAIYTDTKKNLWVGTFGHLNAYNANKDNFNKSFIRNYSTNKKVIQDALYISEDKYQDIWIGSNKGVVKLTDHPKIFIFDFKFYSLQLPNGKKADNVRTLFLDNDSTLWATSTNGLFYYHEPADTFLQLTNKEISSFDIKIAYRKQNKVWISTQKGVYEITNLNKNGNNITIQQIAPHNEVNNVYCLLNDQNNALWMGTVNGLYIKPPKSKTIVHYTSNPLNKEGLSNNIITDIYEDNIGMIWVGTRSGITVYDPYSHKFELYNHLNHPNFSIIHGITEDDNGHIWFTTTHNSLFVLNTTNGILKQVPPEYLPCPFFFNIEYHKNNSFWLTGFNHANGGLYHLKVAPGFYNNYNSKYLKFTRYQHYCDSIGQNRLNLLRDISIINDSTILFSGNNVGLGMATVTGGKVKKFDFKLNPSFKNKNKYNYVNNTPTFLPDSSRNRVWIGTRGIGLTYYDYKQDTFVNYIYNNKNHEGISDRNVSAIQKDRYNRVWIATYNGGLNLFVDSTNSFTRFKTENGLPSNNIHDMVYDSVDNLWLLTSKGLCQFNTKTFNARNYNEYDGLQGFEFLEYAGKYLSNGKIAIGGTNGVNIFRPNISEKICYHAPKVVFTDLWVNHEPVPVISEADTNKILSKKIWHTEFIKLRPGENNFRIFFSSNIFTRPEKTRFQYKLENYNKNWIEVNAQEAFANYTNLPGGKYVFKVKAANADGIWSKEPQELHIVIIPPVYKQPWFIISGIFLIIILTALLFYARVNAIRNRQVLLQKLVRERTFEIQKQKEELEKQADQLRKYNDIFIERQILIEEQKEELHTQNEKLQLAVDTKNKLFSIIAHDLKNPFNSILGLAELLEMKFEKYNDEKKFQLIKQISVSAKRVFRLLENLLSWSRAQSENITVEQEQFNLHKFINEINEVLQAAAAEKNIILENHTDKNQEVYADINLLHTVIRNLINNAIKYTNAGNIITNAYADTEKTYITVADTGIGIPEEIRKNIFNVASKNKSQIGTAGESGTGLGLVVCKEFIDRHNGEIRIESQVGKGTTVFIEIPNKTM